METEALQATITSYWNTRGNDYDSRPRHGIHDPRELAAWLDLLRILLPAPPADVLNVGTGTGFLAFPMAELGYHVTGIDLADGMLDAARRKPVGQGSPPVFASGDATDPPFSPASFDVVTSRWVLWTLLDPARAFRSWYTILRPGGRAIAIDSLHVPSGDAPGWSPYPSAIDQALTMRGLQSADQPVELARQIGFSDVQVVTLDEINNLEEMLHPGHEGESSPRYALVMDKS